MTKNFNILLCFDSNYNLQAEVTMNSLINNCDAPINFYVIHDNPKTFKKMMQRLQSNERVNEVNIYKFLKRPNINFPNFDDSHMTEATYYRLFISDYIPKSVGELMYIDPDIICINNFDDLYKTTLKSLKESNLILAARTEHFENVDSETADRLNLKNSRYFNAGVTLINYKKWIEEEYTENLVKKMNQLGTRVQWYDQDVLNAYIDGLYYELPEKLNFTNIYLSNDEIKHEAILFHYWGKMKPWTVKGILYYGESFYQLLYRSLFNGNYHIVHRYKKDSLKHFFKLLVTLRIFKLDSPFKFIINFLSSLR